MISKEAHVHKLFCVWIGHLSAFWGLEKCVFILVLFYSLSCPQRMKGTR